MTAITQNNQAVANKTALMISIGKDTYQPIAPTIFNELEPERFDENFTISSVDGDIPQVGQADAFPGADIVDAGTKTLTQETFKRKYAMSELLRRYDTEGKLMDIALRIGSRAATKMDRLCADVLNNGFTTETTWDGLSLFHASHVIGKTTQTQSNLISGALDDSSLNDAMVALADQKNHANLESPYQPRYLIVPNALAKKARELVGSELDPESANNTINTYRNMGIQVVVWPLLTSTTAWFLASEKDMHNLVKLVKDPFAVEVRDAIYTDSGNTEVRVNFSMKAGAYDYLGIAGSLGT